MIKCSFWPIMNYNKHLVGSSVSPYSFPLTLCSSRITGCHIITISHSVTGIEICQRNQCQSKNQKVLKLQCLRFDLCLSGNLMRVTESLMMAASGDFFLADVYMELQNEREHWGMSKVAMTVLHAMFHPFSFYFPVVRFAIWGRLIHHQCINLLVRLAHWRWWISSQVIDTFRCLFHHRCPIEHSPLYTHRERVLTG